jgi:hypothetical protein
MESRYTPPAIPTLIIVLLSVLLVVFIILLLVIGIYFVKKNRGVVGIQKMDTVSGLANVDFIKSNLLDGEEIICTAKLHWGIFIKPVLFFTLALIIFISFGNIIRGFGYIVYSITRFLQPICYIILILSIVRFIFAVIDYKKTEICVTNIRISRKRGIVSRITLDIKLNMVETVIFSQGIVGRLFNYGHVYITGVGAIVSKFHGVYDPLVLRNVIIKQMTKKETYKNIINGDN